MDEYEILDNISTSVIITDRFMKITHVNTAAESLLSSSKSILKNTKIDSLFSTQKNMILNQVYDAIALNQSSVSRDIELILKTKSKHFVDCNVQAIFQGDEKHVLLEIRTIRRIKNIVKNANFTNQNNTSAMITRSIAHEIKNPLGGIKGAAQLLNLEIDNKYKEYTDIIISEVDRLKDYIDKMNSSNHLPDFKKVNIHKIIEKIIKILGIKKLNYKKNYDPSIPLLFIDENMVIQSLLNIIKNSHEAITKNGLIEIKTRVDRNYTINSIRHKLVCVISIIDNGIGISDDIKNKLFLPLITDKDSGNGLGLSISQRLISINKGIIIYDEDTEKTTFKIILPISDNNE